MRPYTGDYTEQRKNEKFNFTYYTFTPRPLKGATLFKMDDELAALLVKAHRNLGLLEGLLQYAPNKNSFCELMLLKECTYSRMIDYDAPDFSDILVRRGVGKGDIEPINNLALAYKAATGMQFAAQDYSKICGIALYGDNLKQKIGIRDTQIFLQQAISNLKIYNPTAPENVLPSLADISAYLYDSEDDPLIQAALVHYQFEMIHPFEKYNGVVGRILIFMVLQKIADKALPGLCLSEHLFFNKNEYFDILSATQYSGGYVRWIKYFIRIINESAQTSAALLKKYEETIKLNEERLRADVPQTRSFWSVYEYLKAFPVTSIPIAAKHLNLSYNSISKVFAILQKYNLIMQGNNATRNRVWKYACLDFIFTLPSINQTTCD
ncbi:Fic family protein [Frisingicoccus sp.]|uniref:Fic family protein n=1 Tax=Frisingicoccus sp. TaxID=1918627 RepID=UPI003AB33DC6